MAEMYNYYCPLCGQGYSVGKFDMEHFQCPKPECQAKFQGLVGTKAVVVPKLNPVGDSFLKFKDMRFSTVATKKATLIDNQKVANSNSNDEDKNKNVDLGIGIAIDERDADNGDGAGTKKEGRKKYQRKNKGNFKNDNSEFNID